MRVAVLGRGLQERGRRLALGLAPGRVAGHVALLGWTRRTPALVRALLEAQERPPRVVILVERATAEIEHTLRESLGRLRARVLLRSGDPEQPAQLSRALGRGADCVVLPGRDRLSRDARSEDPRALKILASLDRVAEESARPPRVVVEIADPRRLAVAHTAYRGSLIAIPSGTLVARSLALGILAPGLSSLYESILQPSGGFGLRIERHPAVAGATLEAAGGRFARAVLLGVLAAWDDERLRMDGAARLREEDRLLLLARVGEALAADAPVAPEPDEPAWPERLEVGIESRRVLVLGWSGRLPDLLRELGRQPETRCQLDVLSEVEIPAREALLAVGAGAGRLRHLVGDPTSPGVLDAVDLAHYHCAVLLADDEAVDAAEADSRTVASALLLRHLGAGRPRGPRVIAELLDPANAPVLEEAGAELVVAPELLAHVLAGAVAHPELREGIELLLRGRVGRPGLVPLSSVVGDRKETTFGRVEERLRRGGLVCLGLHREAGGPAVELVPDKRDRLRSGPGDRALVFRPELREVD